MPPAAPSLDSPYAPPRAGRGGGLWRAWFAFRRRSRIGEIPISPAFHIVRSFFITASTLGAVLIPTFGFYLLPNPLWRRIGPAVFWVALFFALTEYGRPLGSASFGLAVAAHGIAAAACSDLHATTYLRYSLRVLRRVLVALAGGLMLTLIASRAIAPHVVLIANVEAPLLINPSSAKIPARVGEFVAYRLDARYGYEAGFNVIRGIYFGRVLAATPDREFSFEPGRYLLDGAPQAALPFMPQTGRVRTADDQLFIWPEARHFHNHGRAFMPSDIGLVPQSALVGRPYKRWFWHKQNTAP